MYKNALIFGMVSKESYRFRSFTKLSAAMSSPSPSLSTNRFAKKQRLGKNISYTALNACELPLLNSCKRDLSWKLCVIPQYVEPLSVAQPGGSVIYMQLLIIPLQLSVTNRRISIIITNVQNKFGKKYASPPSADNLYIAAPSILSLIIVSFSYI